MPHANNEGGDTPAGMEVDTYGNFADRDWAPNEKGFARMIQRIDETVGNEALFRLNEDRHEDEDVDVKAEYPDILRELKTCVTGCPLRSSG